MKFYVWNKDGSGCCCTIEETASVADAEYADLDDALALERSLRSALDRVTLLKLGVALERTIGGFYYITNIGHQPPAVFESLQRARRSGDFGPWADPDIALDAAIAAIRNHAPGLLNHSPSPTLQK